MDAERRIDQHAANEAAHRRAETVRRHEDEGLALQLRLLGQVAVNVVDGRGEEKAVLKKLQALHQMDPDGAGGEGVHHKAHQHNCGCNEEEAAAGKLFSCLETKVIAGSSTAAEMARAMPMADSFAPTRARIEFK